MKGRGRRGTVGSLQYSNRKSERVARIKKNKNVKNEKNGKFEKRNKRINNAVKMRNEVVVVFPVRILRKIRHKNKKKYNI